MKFEASSAIALPEALDPKTWPVEALESSRLRSHSSSRMICAFKLTLGREELRGAELPQLLPVVSIWRERHAPAIHDYGDHVVPRPIGEFRVVVLEKLLGHFWTGDHEHRDRSQAQVKEGSKSLGELLECDVWELAHGQEMEVADERCPTFDFQAWQAATIFQISKKSKALKIIFQNRLWREVFELRSLLLGEAFWKSSKFRDVYAEALLTRAMETNSRTRSLERKYASTLYCELSGTGIYVRTHVKVGDSYKRTSAGTVS
ncbi:hypothetical protein SELMODRAFT_407608 [Selaginella moellendorffii]|uniref:Uncharacterized protein n=1 Tax=Selaginella moellendorffii TaxID=88036 RepID=D8R657_SELML|nr:hypothetical protein SELMODRAFT_407608 [Selaginella moellendorffii]